MRIGIISNDVVPTFGLPCSGNGIRVMGLYQGLKLNGCDATILMDINMIRNRRKSWGDHVGNAAPDYVKIYNHLTANESVFDEFDYLISCNWAAISALPEFVISNINLVYDFFSPTMIESEYYKNDQEISVALGQKKSLVERASTFIANGNTIKSYCQEWLARELGICNTDVFDIPMPVNWMGDKKASNIVLLGGFRQAWTNDYTSSILQYLSNAFPFITFVTVGKDWHYHWGFENGIGNSVSGLNIVNYPFLSFNEYIKINQRACCFIDLSLPNKERLLSLSSRCVVSISCGCPVIHNEGTLIGNLLEQYGISKPISIDANGDYIGILSDLVDELANKNKKSECYKLWKKHFDPKKNLYRLAKHFEGLG